MKTLHKLLLILTVMLVMVIFFSNSAWAEFTFPANISVIEDEAFMGVPMVVFLMVLLIALPRGATALPTTGSLLTPVDLVKQ